MIRIIGEVQGSLRGYLRTIRTSPFSIQLGNLVGEKGFCTLFRGSLLGGEGLVASKRHKFIVGNNDCLIGETDASLGDFGVRELDGMDFFFMRGAPQDALLFHQQESLVVQLTAQELDRAVEEYRSVCPDVVLTHQAPSTIRDWLEATDVETDVHIALQEMFDFHPPKIWLFGHHNIDVSYQMGNTVFGCLSKLNYFDYLTDLSPSINAARFHSSGKIRNELNLV